MLQSCYPYPAYTPVPTSSSPAERFDTSWRAARGAAYDEGVRVTSEDRASGTLRGDKGSFAVLITVAPQADGTIHVAFTVTGASPENVSLQDSLTRAYLRRTGH